LNLPSPTWAGWVSPTSNGVTCQAYHGRCVSRRLAAVLIKRVCRNESPHRPRQAVHAGCLAWVALDLVALRIARYATLVGRENVIAGTDCGYGTWVGHAAVDRGVVWAKLASLADGARLPRVLAVARAVAALFLRLTRCSPTDAPGHSGTALALIPD
jgi:hypothetical protein